MAKFKDLTGMKFGLLTALEPALRAEPSNKCYFWKCVCDCGNIHYANMNNLQRGRVKSCGCLRKGGKS